MDTIRRSILCLCFAAFYIAQSDATRAMHQQFRAAKHFRNSNTKKINSITKFDTYMPLDSPNTDPYASSPYEALPPFPLSENTPPYCVYPPSTPQPPSTSGYTPTPPPASTTPALTPIPPDFSPNPPTIIPTPPDYSPNPPTIIPTPPDYSPNPPTIVPSPTGPVLSPPYYEPSPPNYGTGPPYYEPSPPYYEPSPPSYGSGPPQIISPPSPSGYGPTPRFLPPIVYPPPAVPPPPRRTPVTAMWCVAKAAVPDPIIQEAMNYACFSGAECEQIQPSGSCFEPNTLFAHASYAFNSYWQRTKKAGGSCDFGGTAILVTVDPSYDGCHFVYF